MGDHDVIRSRLRPTPPDLIRPAPDAVDPWDSTMMALLKRGRHTCPACGHEGHCDVSEHYLFDDDRIPVRCRRCRAMWQVEGNPEPGEPLPEDWV